MAVGVGVWGTKAGMMQVSRGRCLPPTAFDKTSCSAALIGWDMWMRTQAVWCRAAVFASSRAVLLPFLSSPAVFQGRRVAAGHRHRARGWQHCDPCQDSREGRLHRCAGGIDMIAVTCVECTQGAIHQRSNL